MLHIEFIANANSQLQSSKANTQRRKKSRLKCNVDSHLKTVGHVSSSDRLQKKIHMKTNGMSVCVCDMHERLRADLPVGELLICGECD